MKRRREKKIETVIMEDLEYSKESDFDGFLATPGADKSTDLLAVLLRTTTTEVVDTDNNSFRDPSGGVQISYAPWEKMLVCNACDAPRGIVTRV
jgi:hypothetical protein